MDFSDENYIHLTNKRSVYFYLHPMVHLLGIAGPSQVFWEANSLYRDLYKLYFVSFTNNILSAQGLGLTNIESVENMQPKRNDLIIIPGVDLEEYIKNDYIKGENIGHKWLKEQNEKGLQICSIGSGSLILAKCGILNHKRCTSHWKCYDYFKKNYSNVKFIKNKIFIKDENLITSAGMSSNIDTILSLIEDHHGPVFVSKLALELLVFIRRFGYEGQESYYLDYKTHHNPLIHQAQNVISSNLNKNYTNAELAGILNTSERNLTRLFKRTLQISISEFKNNLRIELAKHLIHNKSLSIAQIAAECGFSDPRQLRRIWKKQFGENIRI